MSQSLPEGPKPQRAETVKPARAVAAVPRATPAERPAPYYTPPPEVARADSSSTPPWRLAALGVLAAIALGCGAWYAVSAGRTPTPPPSAAAAERSEKTFSVSEADADAKATESLKAMLAVGTPPGLAAVKALGAVNGPSLVAEARSSPQLAEDIQTGRRVLYRVHFLDFLQEDGDQVEVFVDDANYGPVYLTNAGKEILIPLVRGTPSHIKVLATADGGGGVTLGMVSSLGEARTRVMAVGDFEQWQVNVQ